MNRKRPVNLDLTAFRFPLPALTSIVHRISGVFLLIGFGFLLWMFNLSLESSQGFADVQAVLNSGLAKFALWVTLSAVLYHFVAGIKHLLMDAGIGETLEGGRIGAVAVVVIAGVLIVLTGVLLWA